MQDVIDISWWQLLLFSTLLVLPIGINYWLKLGLGKEAFIGIVRMVVQLFLVGLYLEYLFTLNSLWINVLWLFTMIIVGASSIVEKSKLPKNLLLAPVAVSLSVTCVPVVMFICFFIIKPTPILNAQYLIPIAGMLLGNSLSSNIVALQNLFGAFETQKSEYEAAIALGAAPTYAAAPFIRNAIQKAMSPIMASMATTGLVTLPGMMTGQILGGASPMIAIKYQLMIMLAIFVMMSCSLALSLHLALKASLTKEGRVLARIQPTN
ncbi:ABC transporter permease [Vibrio cyclitrophicus FF160]|uniref:ABC transporter permease n=1 Tax=Vibrio cyclitrophicus TaxID=47951 RepID=UPI0003025C38|nr:ABC transporter permease [Vibrio cyclitrophicus]OEE83322.1 ABC transporter permease [Vibrio cyclitrophicus FF160]PMJ22408.1 ABC transporter permease [Vibrio cyclitrophicus]